MVPFFSVLYKIISIVVLLTISIKAQSRNFIATQTESDLAQLFDGIENCDLIIIHGRHKSTFQQLQILPTTVFDVASFPNLEKIFDVSKVRIFTHRIIYTILHSTSVNSFQNRIVTRYLLFRSGDPNGAKFLTRFHLNSNENKFPLVSTNDANLLPSAIEETKRNNFECLGIVKISSERKLELCFGIKTFKTLSLSEIESTCDTILHGRSILQIYQKNRAAPTN